MAGIYIHIPFCVTRCGYCDFFSITDNRSKDDFVQAVVRESGLRSSYLESEVVDTVYFGGGTPSLLSGADVSAVLESLNRDYNVSGDAEITLEVNPDDVRPGFYREMASAGVNRISIGIQTWNDKLLKYLGRRHDSVQATNALELAFSEGFDNVSADIIYGIPGETLADLETDLTRIISFPVKHLSAYHLTVEEGTRFGKLRKEGRLKETDEDLSNSMFTLLTGFCTGHGFIHYEISNFAIEGFISRHNSAYWKQVPYLGLGPSAHSFNRTSRQWNIADVRKYIESVTAGIIPAEGEELDRLKMFNEYVMTSLRTMWGIDLEHVEAFYDKELRDYLINLSEKYVRYGMMKHQKNTLVLTDQGKMISDNILSELMM